MPSGPTQAGLLLGGASVIGCADRREGITASLRCGLGTTAVALRAALVRGREVACRPRFGGADRRRRGRLR